MSQKQIYATLFSGLAFLFGLSVWAGFQDFEDKAQLDIQNSVAGLGVSGDDRFVFAADEVDNRLVIIDTWNWRVVNPLGNDTVNLGGNPTDLAVSRANSRVYVSRDDGKVRQFDVSGLSGLGFDKGLAGLDNPVVWQTLTLSAAGDNLSDIEVIPQQGAEGVDCLFAVNEVAGNLDWFLVDDTGVIGQGVTPLISGQEDLELAAGNNTVFARFWQGAVRNRIYAYRCSTGSAPITEYNTGNDYGGEALQGLGVNRSSDRMVVGNADTKELWLFDTSNLTAISALPGDTYFTGRAAQELLVVNFASENYDIVFVAGGNTLISTPLDESLIEFQGQQFNVAGYSATPASLAQSGKNDQYIYASPEGSASLSIVTANPWVDNIVTDPPSPVGSNTVNVTFQFDAGAEYVLKRTTGFKKSGTMLSAGSLGAGNEVSVNIPVDDLNEGRNIIEANVTDDAGRTGRNAIAVQVDRPPPPLDFDLDFGDQRLIIRFRSDDLPDIDFYAVFYGTNGDAANNAFSEIDDTGLMGDPASPFKVSEPERNSDYELVVEGLENGAVYYVQIVTVDASGNVAVSDRKSAVPQPVGTITDLAGEEGGYECFEQIGPGGGTPLAACWGLFVPMVFVGAARLLRRLRNR